MKKFEHVINTIMKLIDSNVLKEGERIPSIRSMANQIGVSTTTVTTAYNRLESLGHIECRPQSGYYVSLKDNKNFDQIIPQSETKRFSLKPNSVLMPKIVYRIIGQNQKEDSIALGSGLPELSFFPTEELGKHLSRFARDHNNDFNYLPSYRGQKEFLKMIVLRMMEAGCVIQENELFVTNGAIQALMLALRTITKTGDVVAVESPGYYGFYFLLQFFNLKAIEIPSDPQIGIDINVLQTVLDDGLRPACVLLSSNYANPTGALMPETNREALIDICSKHNLPIIEDDTLGELTFDSYRPRPLKALAPDLVLYISSFSKILAPGFRVGWLAGGRFFEDIIQYYGMSVFKTPIVTQLALASYLKDGRLKKHLRRLRSQYKENVDLIRNKVKTSFPQGTRISNPQGGQFLWVELPSDYDAIEFYHAALNYGISVAPGVLFSSQHYHRNKIRLNCALKWNKEIEKAIERLGELLV